MDELKALYGSDIPPLDWWPSSCLEPDQKLQAMKRWAEETIRSLGGDPEWFEWILGDGQLNLDSRQPGVMACQFGPYDIVKVVDREDPADIGRLKEMLKKAINR